MAEWKLRQLSDLEEIFKEGADSGQRNSFTFTNVVQKTF
jgi:hypothetical protein